MEYGVAMKNKIHCINCGVVDDYEIVPSPHETDGDDFKYSKCKCGSMQPLCLGVGCVDAIEVYCPEEECKKCTEIIDQRNTVVIPPECGACNGTGWKKISFLQRLLNSIRFGQPLENWNKKIRCTCYFGGKTQ